MNPRICAGCCALAVSLAPPLRAQEAAFRFTTLAGLAGSVVNSADGTGSAAQFDSPRGVALDRTGMLYVADSSNHTIRKVTPEGIVTTLAGLAGREGDAEGLGGAARFREPFALCVDAGGGILVADTSNHRVKRITPDGIVTNVAGGGGPGTADGVGGTARFGEPRGIAADAGGNIFVADYLNHTVRKVTPDGAVTTLAGLPGIPGSADGVGSAARFRDVHGLACDPAGNLFVADASNHTIRRISAAGLVTTFAGSAGNPGELDGVGGAARLRDPRGVALDAGGNLYVAEYGSNRVRMISPAGAVTTLAGNAPRPGVASAGSDDGVGIAARFNGPSGVAADGGGMVFVADTGNDAVRRITPAGVVSTVAGLAGRTGNVDGIGTAARFHDPYSIAVDAGGIVYVADYDSHTIRRISPEGATSTLAGLAGRFGSADGAGAAARFFGPTGIAVDRRGNVYVADQLNRTIRRITPAGVVSTVAGSPLVAGNVDGVGSAARFSEPHSVVVDDADNLYVTDSANQTIRKITAAGLVTTLAGAMGSPGRVDGPGAAARFTVPYGIGVDRRDGTVYVVDHGNHAIRKITGAGEVTTLAGALGSAGYADGTGAVARFAFPTALAVDRAGNVLVADTDNQVIRMITLEGKVTTVGGSARAAGAADGIGSAARFFNPKGIAADLDGNLYVADRGNHTIRKGTPAALPAEGSARLANLSVRTAVGAGGTLIVGFAVEGGSSLLLIRGGGPALAGLGVGGAMADPRLELYKDRSLVVRNDDWGESATIASAAARVGAFAFAPGSKDSAMLLNLDGAQSIHLTGTAPGIALIELYDAGGAPGGRLANLSVRSAAGSGDEVLICGLFVAGSGPKSILLRAVGGPRLEEFGVVGALADPRIELYRAGSSVLVDGNDDWDASLGGVFSRVGAFSLVPGSRDAALLAKVEAGEGYTVQVRGAGGTGEVLLEIYEVAP